MPTKLRVRLYVVVKRVNGSSVARLVDESTVPPMEPVGGIPLSNARRTFSTFIFQTFQVKFDNKGLYQTIHS